MQTNIIKLLIAILFLGGSETLKAQEQLKSTLEMWIISIHNAKTPQNGFKHEGRIYCNAPFWKASIICEREDGAMAPGGTIIEGIKNQYLKIIQSENDDWGTINAEGKWRYRAVLEIKTTTESPWKKSDDIVSEWEYVGGEPKLPNANFTLDSRQTSAKSALMVSKCKSLEIQTNNEISKPTTGVRWKLEIHESNEAGDTLELIHETPWKSGFPPASYNLEPYALEDTLYYLGILHTAGQCGEQSHAGLFKIYDKKNKPELTWEIEKCQSLISDTTSLIPYASFPFVANSFDAGLWNKEVAKYTFTLELLKEDGSFKEVYSETIASNSLPKEWRPNYTTAQGKTYRFTWEVYNQCTETKASQSTLFKTPVSCEKATTSIVTTVPNPFETYTVINVDIQEAGHLSLSIYDSKGTLLASPYNKEYMPQGQISYTWRTDNLPSGVYYYKVTTDEKTFTNSLIKL